jgi:hypothetical protein
MEFAIAIRCRTVQLCELFFIQFHLPSLMWTYVPCGQLYCSCISSCDWIERLRLICDWVMTWMQLRYDKQLCPMTWTRYKSLCKSQPPVGYLFSGEYTVSSVLSDV